MSTMHEPIYPIKQDVQGRAVNVMYPPAPLVAAKGDWNGTTGTNDTTAIQNLLTNYNVVYFPDKKFLITATLKLRNNMTIFAAQGATLYLQTDATTLLMGNQYADSSTGGYGCIIENLSLEGLGSTHTQTGLNLNGYATVLKNVSVSNFGTGMNLAGTVNRFARLNVQNNGVGINIQDNNGTYNTQLQFEKCVVNYNTTVGITNTGNGQSYNGGTRNVIGLSIVQCDFESNHQAFNLQPQTASMRQCWFDSNTTQPVTKKYGWIFEDNYFGSNGGTQTISYSQDPGYGAYTGTVKLTPGSGTVELKTIDFEMFDSNANDISKRTMAETSNGRNSDFIGVADSSTSTTRGVVEVNPLGAASTYSKMSMLGIQSSGSIIANCMDPKYPVTVTHVATGQYKIYFGAAVNGIPQVMVAPASATATGDNYFCTTRFDATFGESNYASYMSFDTLYINIYDRPSGGGADVLADGSIFLTLMHE